MEKTELGSMIKKARQKKGYTQEVLAEKADLMVYIVDSSVYLDENDMEIIKLLDSSNYNLIFMRITLFIPVLKLPLQNPSTSISVGCTTLKAIIFLHCLIV